MRSGRGDVKKNDSTNNGRLRDDRDITLRLNSGVKLMVMGEGAVLIHLPLSDDMRAGLCPLPFIVRG